MKTTSGCGARRANHHIGRSSSPVENNSLLSNSELSYKRITSTRYEGRIASRHETRVGMRWTRAASAREAVAGRVKP